MKVLIVASTYYPFVKGGAEVSTQKLAEAFAKRGVDVVLLTGAETSSLEELNGVRVRRVRTPNLYWSFRSANQPRFKKLFWHMLDSCNVFISKSLRSILEAERPDIVYTNKIEDFSPFVWLVAKRAGYPVVHTIRDVRLMCPYGTMFRDGRNCRKQCFGCRTLTTPKRWLSRNVDHVVGNSRAVLRRHLAAGYFPDSPSSVIVNIYEPRSGIHPRLHNSEATRFGYIGRLHPAKGPELLIDEFRMARLGAGTKLLIAGQGTPDYEKFLRGRSVGAPIQFLGQQDPSVFFEQIDVLVVPSLLEEPLARVIFEAYAHAIPVIASLRGGSPEIVHAGRTGFTFEPDQKGALAGLLSVLSSNRELIDELRPHCLSESRNFSEEEVAGRYLRVFANQSAAGQRR